jgi:hypothetical protein
MSTRRQTDPRRVDDRMQKDHGRFMSASAMALAEPAEARRAFP